LAGLGGLWLLLWLFIAVGDRQPEPDFSMPTELVSGIDGQKPWLKEQQDYLRDSDLSSIIGGLAGCKATGQPLRAAPLIYF
jgi:hypothetical protein